MLIQSNRFTQAERTALQILANKLRHGAKHDLTQRVANAIIGLTHLHPGQTFETGVFDQHQRDIATAYAHMNGAHQAQFKAQFFACDELMFAARGAGMGATESFASNMADAEKAISKMESQPTPQMAVAR